MADITVDVLRKELGPIVEETLREDIERVENDIATLRRRLEALTGSHVHALEEI
jgi:hypothetical protein